MEPSLRNSRNLTFHEWNLYFGTSRNLTFHEWNLHFGTSQNLTFHEWNLYFGTSRNLTFHEWNLHFGTSQNLTFHEWNLHFGTSRNLTFHEWNLHFGTSRNLTFHEWNLHFGTGSIPSEPLGTWCKVSGGCPKPPRSFIGRTPSLSGCWGKKNSSTKTIRPPWFEETINPPSQTAFSRAFPRHSLQRTVGEEKRLLFQGPIGERKNRPQPAAFLLLFWWSPLFFSL